VGTSTAGGHNDRVNRPSAAVAAVRAAVRRAVDDVPAGALVLVACSGGADSLALAAATAFVAREAGAPGWRAGAVVVDHGLQAGSDDVAARAADTCRDLGLDPVLVRRVVVVGPGEAPAREARHAALAEAADETGAVAVLLGHTLDDQAESVLLGLARGSGPRSLAGMAPVRGVLRRPLMGVTRAQTEAACAAAGLLPWHDPTNAAGPDAPLRSRVRGEVLPVLDEVLGPGVAAALARSAELAREQADAIDEAAAALLAAARAADDPGLDVGVLAAASAGVRRAALRAAAVAAGSSPGALGRVHVLALDALVVDWHGQGPVHLPGPVEGSRRCGRLYLRRGGRAAQ
jgi:tRNA(Ile)-lysidine synthase